MGFINHANKPLKEPRNHRLKVGSLDFLGAVGNNIPETQPPGLHCDDAFVVSFLGPLGPIPRQLYFPKNPNGLSMAVVGPDTKTQGSGPEPNPMCCFGPGFLGLENTYQTFARRGFAHGDVPFSFPLKQKPGV